MPGSRKKKRGKTDDHLHRRRQHHDGAGSADGDDLAVRNVTGKELSEVEEQSARLTALVEMLDEKGVISMREYQRRVAMRLHEISKAGAIEELDEEL
jgi:hypothetical protein